MRSCSLMLFLVCSCFSYSQNTITKEIKKKHIETILINGNQIFNISILTSQTDAITITSTLDGEYQNEFQIVTKIKEDTLELSLEQSSFVDIPDDKRNAHKVIAATLHIEIPKHLNVEVLSDVGSVDASGSFNTISIELLQGHCLVKGFAKDARINTIDGKIKVVTDNAKIIASSNNGKVSIDDFETSESVWYLKSINGDITVVKDE